MQNLIEDLKTAFHADASLFEGDELLKNAVIERALRMDPDLIGMLVAADSLRNHFFTEARGILIFDKVAFQRFVSNKAFLPDSYTAFKNRIGLAHGDDYLKQSQNVVLAWPFKDCVLEGGMTHEDRGRQEVFWNETLAPDDITRLFEPKVLANFQKWDAEAVKAGTPKPVEEISMDDNLLIKGNNLLALHTLKARYAGKVKLIYIDPPYNTGNDGFRYNDRFNHASWLTFMRNRLQVARDLLSTQGAIFISIDANELGYLIALMDETFGRSNFAMCATVKRGSITGHKTINAGVVNVTEYVVSYTKNKETWKQNRVYRARNRNDRYSTFIENRGESYKDWKFISLLDAFSNFKDIPKSKIKKKLGATFEPEIYDFVKKNASSVIQMAYPDKDKVSAEMQALIEDSKASPDQVFYMPRQKESDIYLLNGQRLLFYCDRLMEIDGEIVTGEALSDIWDDVLPNDLHNEGGVTLKKGKKPEKLIKRIIELGSNPGDLILDFHMGSGTTAAVAHKMGRKWIGVEQMNYIDDLAGARLKGVVGGDKTGISKSVKWSGGGSFVRADLLTWNENLVTRVQNATSSESLTEIRDQMLANGYLRHDLNREELAAIDLSELPMEEAQRILISCLDLNHLYVNIGDMTDPTYGVTEEEQRLNLAFQEDEA